jgi:hypothetical protein
MNNVNNCFLYSELHVMMMKSEQVAGCTGAAPGLQRARAALLVCVLDVKSVVSRNAAARLASTSLGMRKLESPNQPLDLDIPVFPTWSGFAHSSPTEIFKEALSDIVFLTLEMNFQSLGSSVFAVLLINWLRTFKFSNLFPSFTYLACVIYFFLHPLFNLFIVF